MIRFSTILICLFSFTTSPLHANSLKKNTKASKIKPIPKSLQSKLLVHYSFDSDNADKILDVSANKNHGMLNEISWGKGVANNCLKFNGVNSKVMMPNFDKVKNSFAIAFWFRTDKMHELDRQSDSGTGGISGQNWAILPPHGLKPENAGTGISVGTNGVSVYEHASDYLPARIVYKKEIGNKWTHVALVNFNKRPILYINGKKVAKTGSSPRKAINLPNHIGTGYGRDPNSNFKGEIDEFLLFKKGLSASEVKQI